MVAKNRSGARWGAALVVVVALGLLGAGCGEVQFDLAPTCPEGACEDGPTTPVDRDGGGSNNGGDDAGEDVAEDVSGDDVADDVAPPEDVEGDAPEDVADDVEDVSDDAEDTGLGDTNEDDTSDDDVGDDVSEDVVDEEVDVGPPLNRPCGVVDACPPEVIAVWPPVGQGALSANTFVVQEAMLQASANIAPRRVLGDPVRSAVSYLDWDPGDRSLELKLAPLSPTATEDVSVSVELETAGDQGLGTRWPQAYQAPAMHFLRRTPPGSEVEVSLLALPYASVDLVNQENLTANARSSMWDVAANTPPTVAVREVGGQPTYWGDGVGVSFRDNDPTVWQLQQPSITVDRGRVRAMSASGEGASVWEYGSQAGEDLEYVPADGSSNTSACNGGLSRMGIFADGEDRVALAACESTRSAESARFIESLLTSSDPFETEDFTLDSNVDPWEGASLAPMVWYATNTRRFAARLVSVGDAPLLTVIDLDGSNRTVDIRDRDEVLLDVLAAMGDGYQICPSGIDGLALVPGDYGGGGRFGPYILALIRASPDGTCTDNSTTQSALAMLGVRDNGDGDVFEVFNTEGGMRAYTDPVQGYLTGPLVADVNGDATPEIILGSLSSLNESFGGPESSFTIKVLNIDGTPAEVDGEPLDWGFMREPLDEHEATGAAFPINLPVAVGDWSDHNGNGTLELLVLRAYMRDTEPDAGMAYARLVMYALPGSQNTLDLNRVPWTHRLGDSGMSGARNPEESTSRVDE